MDVSNLLTALFFLKISRSSFTGTKQYVCCSCLSPIRFISLYTLSWVQQLTDFHLSSRPICCLPYSSDHSAHLIVCSGSLSSCIWVLSRLSLCSGESSFDLLLSFRLLVCSSPFSSVGLPLVFVVLSSWSHIKPLSVWLTCNVSFPHALICSVCCTLLWWQSSRSSNSSPHY